MWLKSIAIQVSCLFRDDPTLSLLHFSCVICQRGQLCSIETASDCGRVNGQYQHPVTNTGSAGRLSSAAPAPTSQLRLQCRRLATVGKSVIIYPAGDTKHKFVIILSARLPIFILQVIKILVDVDINVFY